MFKNCGIYVPGSMRSYVGKTLFTIKPRKKYVAFVTHNTKSNKGLQAAQGDQIVEISKIQEKKLS